MTGAAPRHSRRTLRTKTLRAIRQTSRKLALHRVNLAQCCVRSGPVMQPCRMQLPDETMQPRPQELPCQPDTVENKRTTEDPDVDLPSQYVCRQRGTPTRPRQPHPGLHSRRPAPFPFLMGESSGPACHRRTIRAACTSPTQRSSSSLLDPPVETTSLHPASRLYGSDTSTLTQTGRCPRCLLDRTVGGRPLEEQGPPRALCLF